MLPFHLCSSNCYGCPHIFQLIIVIAFLTATVNSIDCFKCVSYNGANRACDDPFHNNYSTTILESPCMGGRKGRDGLFPATACIKIAGYYDDTGETITVRGCALDSGTLTTDTEIIRMSHCGKFYYDDRYVHGCLQSCSDADACNTATTIKQQQQHIKFKWSTIIVIAPTTTIILLKFGERRSRTIITTTTLYRIHCQMLWTVIVIGLIKLQQFIVR